MMMKEKQTDRPHRFEVKLDAGAQGTIIGDGNFVYQTFYAPPVEVPIPIAPFPPAGFVGHDDVIQHLSELLMVAGGPSIIGIWGAAGVGKSALVKLLAHRVSTQFPNGCLWGDMRQAQGSVRSVLENFALSMGQDPRQFPSTRALQDRIRASLRGRQILLVLDNVSSRAEIVDLDDLVSGAGSVLLLTTRNREIAVDRAEHSIQVVPLPIHDSIRLLRYHAQVSDDIDLETLVERTAGIPLLIETIGRQIRSAPPERKVETVHQLEETLGSPAHQLGLATDDVAYRDVLLLSYNSASVDGQQILRLMGMLSPHPVSIEMLASVLDLTSYKLNHALDALVNLALAEQTGQDTVRLPGVMHALAAELVTQSPGFDDLYYHAASYLRSWIEDSSITADNDIAQAQLEHFLALLELALNKQDWEAVRSLTNLKSRPNMINGSVHVVYNTFWPLAMLDLHFDNSYLDQVDWRAAAAKDFHLDHAWLRNVRLSGAILRDVYIEGSTWSAIDMRGVTARDFYFTECNIDALDLRGVQLRDVYLKNCRLTNVCLAGATLHSVYLTQCIVVESDWSEATIQQIYDQDTLFINTKMPGPAELQREDSDDA